MANKLGGSGFTGSIGYNPSKAWAVSSGMEKAIPFIDRCGTYTVMKR